MGKARRLIALLQRREFLLRLGGTFVAIIGIASAVLTITGRHFDIVGAFLVAGVALLVSSLLHLRQLIPPQVSVEDIFASGIESAPFATVHCPCSLALSSEAKRLAQFCYAGTVCIEPDTYEQLRAKNPYILACMTGPGDEFLGYFDVIPLRESFANPFLKGLVTEMQITHEDVLAPDEMSSCKYLFIAGFAVCNPSTHQGRRSANMLAWAALKYLDRFYGSVRPLTFAVASTTEGDELLRKFSFSLQCRAGARLDRYNLYSIDLTRDAIARQLTYMLNWDRLCVLSWELSADTPMRARRPRRPRLPERRNLPRRSKGVIPPRSCSDG